MNSKSLSFIGTIWLISVCAGFSQPNNDNFANRAQLTGNDVTFVGNIAGATVEPYEYTFGFPASIWWSWTATNTTQVHIVAKSYSQPIWPHTSLTIYPGTNVFGLGYPGNDSGFGPNPYWDKDTFSFLAVAGNSYQIQFCSDLPTLSVTFELIATNAPLIVQPPIDQTVVTNGTALFTVVAVGILPLHYQWRFNGSDLPASAYPNSPMLAFDSVTPEEAGEYTVVVSNATGFAVSSPARLNVNTTPSQPILRAVAAASNSFSFALSADSGRYYRIESSTDLRNWQPEVAFPQRWPMLTIPWSALPTNGSFVMAAGSNTLFTIPRTAPAKYLRASLYTPANEICEFHLRQIRVAIDLWARSTHQAINAVPYAHEDLPPYCANILNLACPLSGPYGTFASSYTVQTVNLNPLCKVDPTNHVLEVPDLTVVPP